MIQHHHNHRQSTSAENPLENVHLLLGTHQAHEFLLYDGVPLASLSVEKITNDLMIFSTDVI